MPYQSTPRPAWSSASATHTSRVRALTEREHCDGGNGNGAKEPPKQIGEFGQLRHDSRITLALGCSDQGLFAPAVTPRAKPRAATSRNEYERIPTWHRLGQ